MQFLSRSISLKAARSRFEVTAMSAWKKLSAGAQGIIDKLAVIGVPSSAGARRTGQERTPELIRRIGLIEHLRSDMLEVVDLGDLPKVTFSPDMESPKLQNLKLVVDVARQTSDLAYRAVQEGMKPFVIGGDCTVTIGVVAGLVRHYDDLGLIYFDGDIDLNTPETTNSGIFDGMVIAHITGKGAQELATIGVRYPLLAESNIVLYGYNLRSGWTDQAELALLKQSAMMRYPMEEIRGRAIEAATSALYEMESKVGRFIIHFDVDAISLEDFPAADVPHEQGLTFTEAMESLRVFASSHKFAGLVITEFNADRDVDGSLAHKLVSAITSAFHERNVA